MPKIDLTKWDENRFIACHIIGGSSADVSKRRIGYPLWEKGWHGYVNDNITKTIDLGFKRISIHNPAGTLPDEEMKADQFIDAEDAKLKWIAADFKDAWRPITDKYEVICYLGSLKLNKRFTSYLTPLKFDNYLNRLYQSYRHPLDAGMSIAFDALFEVSEDDPSYCFYRLLTSMGVRTYIEPTPHKNYPHLFKANFVITEQLYQNRSPDWYPDESLLTGEKIRLLTVPFGKGNTWQNEKEWRMSWVNDCKANNNTAMIGPWSMIDEGTKVSDLINLSSV